MLSRNYINTLKQQTLIDSPNRSKIGIKSHNQVKPIIEQVQELMNSLPPNLINRPWTMAEFVSRLEGKYRPRPHPQKVAEALRILGWRKVRYWRKGYDGVRVWIPKF